MTSSDSDDLSLLDEEDLAVGPEEDQPMADEEQETKQQASTDPILKEQLKWLVDLLADPDTNLEETTKLDLAWQQLSAIPESISCLSWLFNLSLRHNLLTQFPTDILRLTQLTNISLEGNRISNIPLARLLGECQALQVLDLRMNELAAIDDILPPSVSLLTLLISHNAISMIAPDALPQSLAHLEICHNKLTQLSPGALTPLTSLTFFDASYNKLVDSETWGSLPTQLIHLNMSRNNLSDRNILPQIHAKKLMTKLAHLDLSYNKFDNLNLQNSGLTQPHDQADSVSSLTHLDVSHNRIRLLRSAILSTSFPMLKYLDVSHNQLSHLPLFEDGIRSGRIHRQGRQKPADRPTHEKALEFDAQGDTLSWKLQILICSFNSLDELPSELSTLSTLRHLSATDNHITHVSLPIHGHISVLQLERNSLTQLPHPKSLSPNVRSLQLSHNSFAPSAFIDMTETTFTSVVSLDLSNNRLFGIPPNMRVLFPNLQQLLLHGNKGAETQGSVHTNMQSTYGVLQIDPDTNGLEHAYELSQSITSIDFTHSNLKEFPLRLDSLAASTRVHYRSIHSLKLSHNRLTSIPDVFHLLPSLRSIYIGYNYLSEIPPSLVSAFSVLQTCVIYSNKLTTLPHSTPLSVGSLISAPVIQTLQLSHNQLHTIPSLYFALSSLRTLSISRNSISGLPDTF